MLRLRPYTPSDAFNNSLLDKKQNRLLPMDSRRSGGISDYRRTIQYSKQSYGIYGY